jgi:DNA-binding LacI/PurR family transcriptional regulator
VSIVGFDNISEAAYANPGLTTVDQSIGEMGYIATQMLISLIQGEQLESNVHKMPTQLVIRESCRAV